MSDFSLSSAAIPDAVEPLLWERGALELPAPSSERATPASSSRGLHSARAPGAQRRLYRTPPKRGAQHRSCDRWSTWGPAGSSPPRVGSPVSSLLDSAPCLPLLHRLVLSIL